MSDPTFTAKSTETTTRAQPLPWRTVILVVGDAVSFLVFAGIGRSNHGELSGFNAPLYVIGTALPFAAAWFVVSPFVGAFRRDATATLATMFKRTELAWICAWPLAMLLRFLADRIRGETLAGSFLAFMIVVLIINAIFLGLWRGVFAFVTARRN